ncbi:haloacid dehalogenase type II [Pseudoalteromonas sp. L23]|uniref:haloacid dehalogenase type II n=1 Tax=unclassified Pseudoalteromonas TaxID=194690 RepID=UPI001EEFED6A|nr:MULTISPECIES: haloacid dehalogenase type II [unclassified Pseudoalteromonas]MCF7514103.1 haloacid dehalogenase type II [Pseudoalteromonas sp. L7]MCF7526143.1 haloacid dehalogenase type II [Pseudoalteromonas sp. L23]MCX2768998.1 haloacid dehalogenase type II [Pseudoalteromonas sp. B530]
MPNISQANSKVERPEVIFFDVNETLLDLESMNKPVSQVLGGDEPLLPLWFSTMLHHSLVTTVSGDYQDFGKIGVAALQMVAKNKGLTITDSQAKQAIVPALLSLPPHKDVIPALKRLKQAGFKLVSLTNSSNAGVKAQFENAGLITYFDQRLSIEDIKVYKPDLRAYEWALQQLNIRPDQALMVAAHGWDVAGAKAAGMHTAFIARPQKQLYPLAKTPDYVLPDLTSLADELITSGNE